MKAINSAAGEITLAAVAVPAPQPVGEAAWWDILWKGRRVGRIELVLSHAAPVGGHISYTVFPPFRGRDIATQALLLVMAYARQQGMRRLLIAMRPQNAASRAVCRHVGAQDMGLADVPTGHPYRDQGITVLHYFEVPL
nr:GNAT family N-acetyltransferase [bacterium]